MTTTTEHGVDLTALSRVQLKRLHEDTFNEIQNREHDDRIALEEKLRALAEQEGFSAEDVRFGIRKKRGPKPARTNGEQS